jgi:hypothetical protein
MSREGWVDVLSTKNGAFAWAIAVAFPFELIHNLTFQTSVLPSKIHFARGLHHAKTCDRW